MGEGRVRVGWRRGGGRVISCWVRNEGAVETWMRVIVE